MNKRCSDDRAGGESDGGKAGSGFVWINCSEGVAGWRLCNIYIEWLAGDAVGNRADLCYFHAVTSHTPPPISHTMTSPVFCYKFRTFHITCSSARQICSSNSKLISDGSFGKVCACLCVLVNVLEGGGGPRRHSAFEVTCMGKSPVFESANCMNQS